MARRPHRLTGHVALNAALLAAAAGGLVVAAAATHRAATTSTAEVVLVEELTASELAGALARTGLTPEHLAAAGLSAQQTAGLVAAAEDHLAEAIVGLRSDDSALASAQADHDRLLDLVQSGRGSADDAADLVTARSTLAAARAAVDAELAGLLAAATEGLGQAQTAALAVLRTNAGRPVPVKYRVVERTDAEWVELRDALAHSRISQRRGEEVCDEAGNCILSADSAPAVAAAGTNLDSNLAAVTAAWDTGVGL